MPPLKVSFSFTYLVISTDLSLFYLHKMKTATSLYKAKIRISKLFKWHLDSGLKWHWLGNSRLLFVKWLFCNVVISPLNCMWVLSYNSLHCSCSETHLGFSFELMKILASLVAWRLNCPHCLQTRNRLLQL